MATKHCQIVNDENARLCAHGTGFTSYEEIIYEEADYYVKIFTFDNRIL